ncbi:UDP-N-acetylglucosamine 4,6-dehydratase family protein [Methanobrevibacter sp.]|uniref:UDP-N-acetylglucosamine 4,6-dehydratase family protein n=1 Tax=Methanobrevibacter sp. TaxID=66852 RepID=UPI0025E8E511|nr:UDP-N-acetylglucosamine 4,6-dehydratase family protein [Methanobrevibacter sp.]MBQ2666253.1 polysaccharide biosynthesis protein [Methanobrevibacter sp.]
MLNDFYKGKKVLVTGGSGSIGQKIVKELLNHDVDVVRVLDNNETALFDLEQDLNSSKIRTLVGDIRDYRRLERAFKDIDIIFHAAAYKHVPLCEYNPMDAVKTNVIGTQNVIDAAINCGVEKVILISTDKAVNPVNVMGATKLLAERLMISSNVYSGRGGTKFSCVRFGNVLNSRGSVIPVFKKQISNGGPVTITDESMTRFIMHIYEAAKLILDAGKLSCGGEIFILKMPSVRLSDLADAMIEFYAPKYGFNAEEIDIEIIGRRVGEKLHEDLMTPEEMVYAEDNGDLFIIREEINEHPLDFIYNSSEIEQLSKNEIMSILNEIS